MLGNSAIRQFEVMGYHPGSALKGAGELKNGLLPFSGSHRTQEGLHRMFHRVSPFNNLPGLDLSDSRQRRLIHSGLLAADFNALEAWAQGSTQLILDISGYFAE